MKKLLIAMTVAAVGTCAWAAVEVADATLLNENFNKPAEGWSPSSWTVAEDGKVSAVAAPWSYAGGTDVGDGELTLANNALSLNTGSKVLTAAFAGGYAVTIPSTNVYFNATVTFKDPSDTLPELKDSDKFALVVLDNVESVDAKYTSDAATNLWVIAKYGENAQRAYQLDVAVTPIWLADEHEIVVKAYENVMASGYTACAGFIVMVDKAVCKVVQSCALEGNVINYAKSCAFSKWNDSLDENVTGNLGYLGYPLSAIDPKYQKHCCDPEDNNTSVLILSNVPSDGTLTSVDFQGQGDIDNVNLAATTTEDFGTDSSAIAVTADAGVTLKNCADGTLYYSGNSAEITFELGDGYKLKGVSTNAVKGVDGVYLLTIDPTQYTEYGFKVEAFWPVVSFVTTDSEGKEITIERGSLSEAIDDVDAGAELKLTDAITLTEAVAVDKNITINLNGKTLSATLTDDFASMFALADGVTLTITDTTGGVLQITGGDNRLIAKGPDRGGAAVAINAGTIKADIANGTTITYALIGGQYDTDVSAVLGGNYVATKAEGSEYWTVAEKVVATTYAVTVDASANATVTGLKGGDVEAGTALKFQAVAKEGYKNLVVKADGVELEADTDGYYNYTVNAAVTITITVEAKAQFAVAVNATGATTTLDAGNYYEGTELSFTVAAEEGYEAPFTVTAGETVLEATDGTYTFTVNAAVTIMVEATKKVVVPLQPLPEGATDDDVSAALGTQADTAVTANITTVADYTEFQAWAANAGTAKVADSVNAYAAYVLDAAGLLDETDKLGDADIKVKAFAQDATAQTAGTFALEIKIKDCEIGASADPEKLDELIIAEGTSELGNAENPFNKNNVTKTVTVEGGKAKFKVNAKGENITKFFFKMKFNK